MGACRQFSARKELLAKKPPGSAAKPRFPPGNRVPRAPLPSALRGRVDCPAGIRAQNSPRQHFFPASPMRKSRPSGELAIITRGGLISRGLKTSNACRQNNALGRCLAKTPEGHKAITGLRIKIPRPRGAQSHDGPGSQTPPERQRIHESKPQKEKAGSKVPFLLYGSIPWENESRPRPRRGCTPSSPSRTHGRRGATRAGSTGRKWHVPAQEREPAAPTPLGKALGKVPVPFPSGAAKKEGADPEAGPLASGICQRKRPGTRHPPGPRPRRRGRRSATAPCSKRCLSPFREGDAYFRSTRSFSAMRRRNAAMSQRTICS